MAAVRLQQPEDLTVLFEHVIHQACKLVDADRATLFLVDRHAGQLWSKVAEGSGEIRLPLGSGLVGHCAASGRPVVLADAYSDPRFNRAHDIETGTC